MLGVSRGQQLDSRLGRLSCLVFRVCKTSKLFSSCVLETERVQLSQHREYYNAGSFLHVPTSHAM
jgi:hypothetical protein